MPNSIYPDDSQDRFNTRYQRLKILPSDLFVSKQGQLVMGESVGTAGGGGGEDPGGLNPGDGVQTEVPNPLVPTVGGCCPYVLIFLDRFRVQSGGTMEEGGTSYINDALLGYEFLVLSNGIEVSQAIVEEQRYITKLEDPGNELFFNGSVTDHEVIEIYLKFYPKHDNLIDWFVVDGPDSPMVDGQTTYVNSLLSNGKFIMYSGEIAIHQMTDESNERYCTKPNSGAGDDTITINGGVTHNEIIHIYKVY